jgi:hypothetical protein
MAAIDYEGGGLRQLAAAVLLLAIEDYRRDPKDASARRFLQGRTPGPAGASMLEFCCNLARINQECVGERILCNKKGATR